MPHYGPHFIFGKPLRFAVLLRGRSWIARGSAWGCGLSAVARVADAKPVFFLIDNWISLSARAQERISQSHHRLKRKDIHQCDRSRIDAAEIRARIQTRQSRTRGHAQARAVDHSKDGFRREAPCQPMRAVPRPASASDAARLLNLASKTIVMPPASRSTASARFDLAHKKPPQSGSGRAK
jgi:hypothetical protein